MRMRMTLADLPIDQLREMLRNTEAACGADCDSAKIIRRAIEKKSAAADRLASPKRRSAQAGKAVLR